MGEVSIPEKDKKTFILDRDELFNLYNVLVAGYNCAESTAFVLFFSEPVENSVNPDDVPENFFILTLNNSVVGRIVRYAQSVHHQGNYEGPSLSDLVRNSLIKGRKRIWIALYSCFYLFTPVSISLLLFLCLAGRDSLERQVG